jgi:2-polyprenyl-3-methyl-5-hydroxy-6-metoxy-1,4-benzoquinol methylase
MDIYHKIFEVARKGKLHSAPLHVDPNGETRILDIGCGTGIWAIDMAE